eukprot:TRINITY_DN1423_c0_g1_i4.p1 TRINITY_DN1423_c0_g1~~TRINITY_DN1423_c0_g1_i4.p1  ORF type:complete len:1180 (-),score=244.91 TRINITY_DN1423_c0_g1_i4:530-4069(-)
MNPSSLLAKGGRGTRGRGRGRTSSAPPPPSDDALIPLGSRSRKMPAPTSSSHGSGVMGSGPGSGPGSGGGPGSGLGSGGVGVGVGIGGSATTLLPLLTPVPPPDPSPSPLPSPLVGNLSSLSSLSSLSAVPSPLSSSGSLPIPFAPMPSPLSSTGASSSSSTSSIPNSSSGKRAAPQNLPSIQNIITPTSDPKRMKLLPPLEDTVTTVEGGLSDLDSLFDALNNNKLNKLVGIITEHLNCLRYDTDKMNYLSIFYVAKRNPEFFRNTRLRDLLLSFLGKESHLQKRSSVLPILACNIFSRAYNQIPNWPIEFVKMYIEDAFGDRVWVDDECTTSFVENICTAFSDLNPTDKPNSEKLERESDLSIEEMEDEIEEEVSGGSVQSEEPVVYNRYSDEKTRAEIKTFILDTIHAHLKHYSLPSHNDNPRNIIKFLIATSGYRRARVLASTHLDEWLNNTISYRFAKELLPKLVNSCSEASEDDINTVTNILKLKVKSLHSQLYLDNIAILLKKNREYPALALKHFINNDMLQQKGQPNMKTLVTIFRSIPGNPEEELAFIFKEIASTEHKSLLRGLLRKIVKAFNRELKFAALCKGLMHSRGEFYSQDPLTKESWVLQLVDIICQSMILSVPPNLSEGVKDQASLKLLREFQVQIASIQTEAIKWCHLRLPKYLPHMTQQQYTTIIRTLLFLEKPQTYFVDPSSLLIQNHVGTLTDQERHLMQLLTADIPFYEECLTRIVIISLTPELPLNNADALEIMELILRRASPVKTKFEGYTEINTPKLMEVNDPQMIDAILKLVLYRQDESKSFAVTNWFWHACLVLLLLSTFNAALIGRKIWKEVPSLKLLMEMLITRSWSFPPYVPWDYSGSGPLTKETIQENEVRYQRAEREQILAFETSLAARSDPSTKIDETNSVLISQLMRFDNKGGPPRPPPPSVIKKLEQLDAEFRIGHNLCCSRDPDFLLDIMQRQGARQAMVWLKLIIEGEPDTLEVLPIPCLCELLLNIYTPSSSQLTQLPRLLARLVEYLSEPKTDYGLDILKFFFQKLSHKQVGMRDVAKRSLTVLLETLCDSNIEKYSVNTDMIDVNNHVAEPSGDKNTTQLNEDQPQPQPQPQHNLSKRITLEQHLHVTTKKTKKTHQKQTTTTATATTTSQSSPRISGKSPTSGLFFKHSTLAGSNPSAG